MRSAREFSGRYAVLLHSPRRHPFLCVCRRGNGECRGNRRGRGFCWGIRGRRSALWRERLGWLRGVRRGRRRR